MKRTILLLLFFLVLASACRKEAGCEEDYITLRYLQTQCADAWQNSLTDSVTIANVKAYLQNQSLYVGTITIKNDAPAALCLACACPTGKTIYVTTLNTSAMVTKYLQLGFVQ